MPQLRCHWCGHTGDDVTLGFAPLASTAGGASLPSCDDDEACATREHLRSAAREIEHALRVAERCDLMILGRSPDAEIPELYELAAKLRALAVCDR